MQYAVVSAQQGIILNNNPNKQCFSMHPDEDRGSTNMNVIDYGFTRRYVSSINNTELFKTEQTIAVTSSDVITDAIV